MFRTGKIITVLIILLFSANLAYAFHIEVAPATDAENSYYEIKINDTVTFTVKAIGWDEKTQTEVKGVEFSNLKFTFDSRFLQKISQDNQSITLKAVKARTSALTITLIAQGKAIEKKFLIVAKRQ